MSGTLRPEHADTLAAPASGATERPELAATRADSQAEGSGDAALARGAQIGRYLVVDSLGAGGMGTVYAAYDPELDRKVAIKVLRVGANNPDDTAGRTRLLREAQAIARLAHPNVVAVHDVGPCFDDQVFIAMELVEGTTLAGWLHERDHTLAEILDVFVQAGRGLAAAHRAGLVHRDFKPDNVLVGRDGRARVADFGLVREVDAEPMVELERPSNSALSIALTQVGSLMGTPRYMAPEQRARRTVDDRGDQYSFCVSLYEALHGALPDVVTAEISDDAPVALKPAPNRRIPLRVRAALFRGLNEDPAARWPTIDALLAELERDPSARRKRWVAVVGAVAIAGAAATIGAFALRPGARDEPCTNASQRLVGAWDPVRRAEVEHAFDATKTPYAAAAFATVSRMLDGYAAAWTHSYEDSCRATHIRHEQSPELLDLRTTCLLHRRGELAALVDLWTIADHKLVARAVAAAGELPPVADCDNVAALQSPVQLPADGDTRRAIDEVREESASVTALTLAARYNDALPRAQALLARAQKLAYKPLEAEAGLRLGQIEGHTGNVAKSILDFVAAFEAAMAGRDDHLLANIAIALVEATAADFARGEQWADIADAAIDRLGKPAALEADAAHARGYLFAEAAKWNEAIAQHERARAIRERIAPGSLDLGKTYAALARALDDLGRYAEARAMAERGLAIETAQLGPDHPGVAMVLNDLGNIAIDEGKLDDARRYYERVQAIRERAVLAGDDPSSLADIIHNLGVLAVDQDRPDDAIAQFQHAIDLRRKVDPKDVQISMSMSSIGSVLAHRGKYGEALTYFQGAADLAEAKLGPTHPFVGDALLGVGTCLRELGKLEPAQVALERSMAIRTSNARPLELAEAQFALATVAWLRGSHARALALARAARLGFESSPDDLANLDDWLQDHH
jgi:eukaryotic-like serine/threonine-protein kinase